MPKLTLRYREVAQANIDRFDELGAFAGEQTCKYHYESGKHCAIGLMDPERLLIGDLEIVCVDALPSVLIEADNMRKLGKIQYLHDEATRGRVDEATYRAAMQRLASEPL